MRKDEPCGHLHPISSLIREANLIFLQMGFTLVEVPLLESEWYNFDALNVPKDHPARDMQDTFYLKNEPGYVLRTHTSGLQIRYMTEQIKKGVLPPYRVIAPGKCFRNEATDMTHEAEFFSEIFKGDVDVRFRPSFFPFTEPSIEVDMRLTGTNVTAKLRDKWIEIAGAGLSYPPLPQ